MREMMTVVISKVSQYERGDADMSSCLSCNHKRYLNHREGVDALLLQLLLVSEAQMSRSNNGMQAHAHG